MNQEFSDGVLVRTDVGVEPTVHLKRALRARRSAPRTSDEVNALTVLDAFDRGMALLDLTHRTFSWCSPSFESHLCVSAGATLAQLEVRLPGVSRVLEHLPNPLRGRAGGQNDDSSHSANWRCGEGQSVMELQAVLVRPGLAAIRILDSRRPLNMDDHVQAMRRHLEDRERLLFTSRTLSVSEMASTLAHELNQPIGTVTNVLRGIQARLEASVAEGASGVHQPMAAASPAALVVGVKLALDQALFAARIISRIRDYTHTRQPRCEELDLAVAIRESLSLLDWEIQREGITVGVEFTDIACIVMGDEVMLQQLFVNLLRNAIEAMRDAQSSERRLDLHLQLHRGGREAWLSIRDTGCGLEVGAEQRLFLPFHSSKPNGMGIGLNICRSFAELHQGRLWFERNESAEPDSVRGSTFFVALPIIPAPALGGPESSNEPNAIK